MCGASSGGKEARTVLFRGRVMEFSLYGAPNGDVLATQAGIIREIANAGPYLSHDAGVLGASLFGC